MQKVILVGNPNTGKTTLFNSMTKSNEHTGNWHGVTINVKSVIYKFKNEKFEICDLPGLYSLDPYSLEEKNAYDFIISNKNSIFICIADANNLRRNLYLCTQLKKYCQNVILAINMYNEIKPFEIKQLSKELEVEVCIIDARKKQSSNLIKQKVFEMAKNNLKNQKEKGNIRQKSFEKQQEDFNLDKFQLETQTSFKSVELALKNSKYDLNRLYGTSKFDKLLLNPFWSIIFFVLVISLVFVITFGSVGTFISQVFNNALSYVAKNLLFFIKITIKNKIILDFIENAILKGTLDLLSFVPQIVIMLILINILEETGYLSRVAIMFDYPLKKLGLSGRSVFSLIMGFGCTTTAIMTTTGLDSKNQQKKTAFLLPFISCSAKLPFFLVIISAFFSKFKVLIILLLYMLSILVMIITSIIIEKFDNKEQKPFIMEVPKIRFPSVTKILKNVWQTVKSFIIRVGSVLLISTITIYILYNFNYKFEFVGTNGNNLLKAIANVFSFIFKPFGFNTFVVIALLSGLIAKEMLVSTLAIINGVGILQLASSISLSSSVIYFNLSSALAFLVFVLLYPPCISALITLKKQVGLKVVLKSVLVQFTLAYVIALIVKVLADLYIKGKIVIFTVLLIFIALTIFIVIKYIKPRKKGCLINSCENCKNYCHGERVWKC